MPTTAKDATPATVAANREAVALYDMDDRQDFADADRGHIADFKDRKVLDEEGKVVFDLSQFDYLAEDAPVPADGQPESLAPVAGDPQGRPVRGGRRDLPGSQQRHRELDDRRGRRRVGDHRLHYGGGERAPRTGDVPRARQRQARGGGDLHPHAYRSLRGVKGVVDPEAVRSGKVPIIAPGRDFDKYAIGENVVAGNAMSRRALYAFGNLLGPSHPRGFTTCGMAIGGGQGFTVSYISPTDIVTETGATREIAGLTFEFLYAPDTEAPEEMHIWIPQLKALTCAENANHSLHNIQTLRGARTRDSRNFSRFLDETLERWGDQAEVHYGPHTWPVWGNREIVEFLESQRDTYKYIHDQSLRLANQGYTPLEAAEEIELPDQLGRKWYNRGYHGTLHHDVRGVYTKELGMWDGDPVSLHPHPLAESAKRYVDLVGAEKLMQEGQRAFDAADYRWAAQILHHLLFAHPDNQPAREPQADAYEQLGYQAEGPQWRNIYLTAAKELREGVITNPFTSVSPDTILAMPIDILFDFAAVHINGPAAANADIRIDFAFTDLNQTWTAWVKRGVLNARTGASTDNQLTVSGAKAALVGAILQPASAAKLAEAGQITLHGDASALDTYARLLDDFDPSFEIIAP